MLGIVDNSIGEAAGTVWAALVNSRRRGMISSTTFVHFAASIKASTSAGFVNEQWQSDVLVMFDIREHPGVMTFLGAACFKAFCLVLPWKI